MSNRDVVKGVALAWVAVAVLVAVAVAVFVGLKTATDAAPAAAPADPQVLTGARGQVDWHVIDTTDKDFRETLTVLVEEVRAADGSAPTFRLCTQSRVVRGTGLSCEPLTDDRAAALLGTTR